MRFLFLKLLRDIRLAKGQYIAITLVVILGVAFYSGLTSASNSVGVNVNTFYENQQLADFWIRVSYASEETLHKIQELPGIEAADRRATLAGVSGDSDFIIHTLPANPIINVPFIESGNFPVTANDLIVDRGYATANNLSVGDNLDVTIGGIAHNFTISGIFISPEYLYISRGITEMPDHYTFGVIFVNNEFAGASFNEFIIRAAYGADFDNLITELQAVAVPYGTGVIFGREQLLSWAHLNPNIQQFDSIGIAFALVFFFVAAAIIFISMSKNIDTQRSQIGNMKALGVRSKAITFHFTSYTLITCAIGSILGAVFGLLAVFPLIQMIFTSIYLMPELSTVGFWGNALIASAIAFAFGVAATLFSIRKPLKESPASVMRPKPPRKAKILFLERYGLWAKIPYNRKIILRNLFLNKGRALLSSIGVIGCVGLMVAAFWFVDSLNDVTTNRFIQMNQYDMIVTLNAPVSEGHGLPFYSDYMVAAWAYASVTASFSIDNTAIASNLIAVEANNTAIVLHDSRGNHLSFPVDGVIIPALYAGRYGITIGDSLNLTLTPVMGEARSITITVRGIAPQYLNQNIYTTFEYLQSLGETLPVSTFLLNISGNIAAVVSELEANAAISQIMTIDELASAWEQGINLVRLVMYVFVAASAVLALTVVYNISAINIYERRRDIATLKVLGYHRREVYRLVFNENLLITAFGAVCGIGVGVVMLRLLLNVTASDGSMFPMVITLQSAIISIALSFAFTVLANQLLKGKVKRIDMVESLKSVE